MDPVAGRIAGILDRLDLHSDVLGRVGRLLGQRLGSLSDDRKYLVGITGARRVGRQKIGPAVDLANENDHRIDLRGALSFPGDSLVV